jgi:uncharacterized protein YjbJ (UPF0337 family)
LTGPLVIPLTVSDPPVIRCFPPLLNRKLGDTMADRNDTAKQGMKDQLKGAAKQAEGRVRGTVGAATGDTGEQVKGKAQEIKGKVQRGFGKAEQDADADRDVEDE